MPNTQDFSHGNAMMGAKFHNRGKRLHRGPLGYSSMKSHGTGSGPGIESPNGYRSRGPSAERQKRKLARIGLYLRAYAAGHSERIAMMIWKRKAIKATPRGFRLA